MRHASHLALSNPSRCAPRRGFQTRYGFKRDYYAVKSHYVSACPANPQSRHRQDYYAVKSHFVPTIAPRVALPKPSRRAPRRGFQARYGFQSRLLRAEISSRGGAAARVHVLSPMSSPCARRAGDVAPYHGRHGAWTWCALFMMVGADVPGGPRTRCRPRCRPRVRGAPGTSRPTMGASTLKDNLRVSSRSVLTGRRTRTSRRWNRAGKVRDVFREVRKYPPPWGLGEKSG